MTRKTKLQTTSEPRSAMRQSWFWQATTMYGGKSPVGGLFSGLLLLFAFAGCADRTYLTKSHGRANTEAFGRQMANPGPQPKTKRDATQGLDSQEATAVAGAYRRSLAGREGGDAKGQQMVIMNPAAAQQGGNMPPPSIPGGQ